MYQLTNKLIEKGLVSYFIRDNVRYFSAANPKILLKDLNEKKTNLERVMPDLIARQKLIRPKTKVEIFQGRKGVSAVLRLMASIGKDYFFIGGLQEICTKFEVDAYAYAKIAQKHSAKGKIIARKKDKFFIAKNEDYRFVPEDLLSSTSKLIVGDKVIIFVWSEPYYAILIESAEIAKNDLDSFKYLWRVSEKPTKEDRAKRLEDS